MSYLAVVSDVNSKGVAFLISNLQYSVLPAQYIYYDSKLLASLI